MKRGKTFPIGAVVLTALFISGCHRKEDTPSTRLMEGGELRLGDAGIGPAITVDPY